jgi:hypothetical protein
VAACHGSPFGRRVNGTREPPVTITGFVSIGDESWPERRVAISAKRIYDVRTTRPSPPAQSPRQRERSRREPSSGARSTQGGGTR